MKRTDFINQLKRISNKEFFIFKYLIVDKIDYESYDCNNFENAIQNLTKKIQLLIKDTELKNCSIDTELLRNFIINSYEKPIYLPDDFSDEYCDYTYLSFNDVYDLLNDKPEYQTESVFRIETEKYGLFQSIIRHKYYFLLDEIIKHQEKNIDNLTQNKIEELKFAKKLKKSKEITTQYIAATNNIAKELSIPIPEYYKLIDDDSKGMIPPTEDGAITTVFSAWSHSYHKDWIFGFKTKEMLLNWLDKSGIEPLFDELKISIKEYQSNCIIHSENQTIFKINT